MCKECLRHFWICQRYRKLFCNFYQFPHNCPGEHPTPFMAAALCVAMEAASMYDSPAAVGYATQQRNTRLSRRQTRIYSAGGQSASHGNMGHLRLQRRGFLHHYRQSIHWIGKWLQWTTSCNVHLSCTEAEKQTFHIWHDVPGNIHVSGWVPGGITGCTWHPPNPWHADSALPSTAREITTQPRVLRVQHSPVQHLWKHQACHLNAGDK